MPNKKLTKDEKAYIRNQKKFLLKVYDSKCVCCGDYHIFISKTDFDGIPPERNEILTNFIATFPSYSALKVYQTLYDDLIIKKIYYKCNKCKCEYIFYSYGLDRDKNKVEITKFANMDV